MHKWLSVLALMIFSPLVWAVSPYVQGDKVAAGDIQAVMGETENKLTKAGFNVIGKYAPVGLPGYGVVVVTDNAMLGTIKSLGGANIVGAAIRIGVKADGSVSYMNPDYWYRAYFRTGFKVAERTVKALQAKLAKALGARGTFGGDVAKTDLSEYQYMFGMESFESDKNLLIEHLTFEDAIKAIQDNLARGTGKTSKVYEVIMPDKKVAVFGVAMNDAKEGEGWWVKAVGADNIAALPYEIYVVGPKVDHLFARYRIALGWPAVGMGQFMRIVEAPYIIQDTLAQAAGGAPAGK
ncbi:MAG: hypothetical protein HGA75_11790 [Thiobacillus sp.]|nr:hypothetical protein [Thiobacillus sp.]